jgi:hypothetical protein
MKRITVKQQAFRPLEVAPDEFAAESIVHDERATVITVR